MQAERNRNRRQSAPREWQLIFYLRKALYAEIDDKRETLAQSVGAANFSPTSKLIVSAAIMLVGGTCFLSPVFGQEPVKMEQGPEAPARQSDVEELKAKVKQLEGALEEIKRKEASPAPPLSAGTSTEVPAIDRERAMFRQDSYAEARLDNAPFDPQLRGFWAIPGSHTMMRIGGYIRTDAIYDFSQLGNINQFRPESIPTPNLGTNNYNMSVRASRLSLESRTDTSLDVLRTYIEVDFVGPGNSVELRIRHFYGQLKNLLVGQAWSTFSDSDVIPETADFNGPNSWIFQFNPQVRYSYALNKENHVMISAEQPQSQIPTTTPVTDQPVNPTSPIPDFVVRYRHETDDNHFNTAALFRSIGGVDTITGQSAHVFGYGVMASGLLRLQNRDNFVFQAVYGAGITRYFNDTGTLNLDAGFTSSGALKAQPAYGGFASLQHFWSEKWRSNVTYGFLQVNTTDLSPANTYKRTQYTDWNLMYSPGERFTVGGGLIWGQRVDKNDVSGEGFRINIVLQYDLVSLQQDLKKLTPF
jgi:hypothetical protein